MVENLKSILVVKPSSFGDVVHALPAVALLKKAWPQARLTWLINPEWIPLLDGNPDVDGVLPFPRADFRGLRGLNFFGWCREQLGRLQPDLTIDFQGLLRSAWMARASRPKRLLGMSDAREGARFLYNDIVQVPAGAVHAVERYLEAARGAVQHLGGHVQRNAPPGEVWRVPAGSPVQQEELPENFLLLHPYARGTGKSLSQAQIEAFCRLLAPRPVVLAGRTAGQTKMRWPENCVDLLDQTTLSQLIWLIRRAAVVITVDSGPSHLAAALRRPMIAIHTWSDPRRVGPYFEEALVWKNGRLLTMGEIAREAEAFFQAPVVLWQDHDIATMAAAATSLSDSCA